MGAQILATVWVVLAAFALLWLLSLRLQDSSIVDIAWGPGFVLVATLAAVWGEGYQGRRVLLLVLTAIWGLRLGFHIGSRNLGAGEDPRYQRMRARSGRRWWWVSLLQVFVLQAILLAIVSLPIQVAGASALPGHLTVWDALGTTVWLVGFSFEAVGDLQLRRFKASSPDRGSVMDRGLWRYTRHPNYFGDAVLWWGIGIIALQTSWGWVALIGPVIMSFLLIRVSGVSLLERDLLRRRPGYEAYVARTNAFWPGPPKQDQAPAVD